MGGVPRSIWSVFRVGLAVWATGTMVAACGSSSAVPQSPSSAPPKVSIRPNARPGQIPPSPSTRSATLGLRSLDPSRDDGVQLDVLSGLENDSPIFDGDFADPFALRTADAIYLYATNTVKTKYAPAAHIPTIVLTRDSGFEGQYLGDALPTLPKWTVSGFQWGPSVWARPDGTYVLYYSTPATASFELPGPQADGRLRLHCDRPEDTVLHLASHKRKPGRSFRRRFVIRVRLPGVGRWGNRPERVRRLQRDAMAPVEERWRLLWPCNHDLLAAVVSGRPVGGWTAPPVDRRVPDLGRRPRRGSVHG